MSFSLEELLNQNIKNTLIQSKINPAPLQKYNIHLNYATHPNGKPIYTRICKTRIEAIGFSYLKEEEIRPLSRRDSLLAHQSYWDKPLFKVFYRKLLDEIPRGSIFYFQNEIDLNAWEHATIKLGINNAFTLRLE